MELDTGLHKELHVVSALLTGDFENGILVAPIRLAGLMRDILVITSSLTVDDVVIRSVCRVMRCRAEVNQLQTEVYHFSSKCV